MNDPRLKRLRLESSEKHRLGTLFYKVAGLGNVLCVSSHSGKIKSLNHLNSVLFGELQRRHDLKSPKSSNEHRNASLRNRPFSNLVVIFLCVWCEMDIPLVQSTHFCTCLLLISPEWNTMEVGG